MKKNIITKGRKVCIILVLFLSINFVYAEENCSGDSCNWEINKSLKVPEIKDCEMQLTFLLDKYNNLTEDYQNGTSCGTLTNLLKENNAKLSANYHNCTEDLELVENNVEGYQKTSYVLLITLLFATFYIFYLSSKIKDGKR